jgi:DNA-binding Lrp family transcriptional regulator
MMIYETLYICIPVKDIAKYLPKTLKNVENIIKYFKNNNIIKMYEVILAYDNSTDMTLNICNIFKNKMRIYENINVSIVQLEPQGFTPYRTWNISRARNMCLNYIKKYLDITKENLMIMMDGDDVNTYNINYNVLNDIFINSTNIKWDCLTFIPKSKTHHMTYYDIWALLRNDDIQHCWGFYPREQCISYIDANRKNIVNTIKNEIQKGNKYYEVISAFAGFGIYKINKYINCKYDGKNYLNPNDDYNFNTIKEYDDESKNDTLKLIYAKYNIDNLNWINTLEVCEHLNFHIEGIKNYNCVNKIYLDNLFI